MRDDIDLGKVTILNSPDIYTWPATKQITKLDLSPEGVYLEFDGQPDIPGWPDVPTPTPGDSYLFTLWIVLQIASSWWAAGCIEFYRGLKRNGGPVDQYAANWYYDPLRWTPMAGHQPAPGEFVGFLVTSGDARHGNTGSGLHERSNIVGVKFPQAPGQVFTWPVENPAPAPEPTPPPEPPPAPAPPPVTNGAALAIAQLELRVTALEGQATRLRMAISDIAVALDGIADGASKLAASIDPPPGA